MEEFPASSAKFFLADLGVIVWLDYTNNWVRESFLADFLIFQYALMKDIHIFLNIANGENLANAIPDMTFSLIHTNNPSRSLHTLL